MGEHRPAHSELEKHTKNAWRHHERPVRRQSDVVASGHTDDVYREEGRQAPARMVFPEEGRRLHPCSADTEAGGTVYRQQPVLHAARRQHQRVCPNELVSQPAVEDDARSAARTASLRDPGRFRLDEEEARPALAPDHVARILTRAATEAQAGDATDLLAAVGSARASAAVDADLRQWTEYPDTRHTPSPSSIAITLSTADALLANVASY